MLDMEELTEFNEQKYTDFIKVMELKNRLTDWRCRRYIFVVAMTAWSIL